MKRPHGNILFSYFFYVVACLWKLVYLHRSTPFEKDGRFILIYVVYQVNPELEDNLAIFFLLLLKNWPVILLFAIAVLFIFFLL